MWRWSKCFLVFSYSLSCHCMISVTTIVTHEFHQLLKAHLLTVIPVVQWRALLPVSAYYSPNSTVLDWCSGSNPPSLDKALDCVSHSASAAEEVSGTTLRPAWWYCCSWHRGGGGPGTGLVTRGESPLVCCETCPGWWGYQEGLEGPHWGWGGCSQLCRLQQRRRSSSGRPRSWTVPSWRDIPWSVSGGECNEGHASFWKPLKKRDRLNQGKYIFLDFGVSCPFKRWAKTLHYAFKGAGTLHKAEGNWAGWGY